MSRVFTKNTANYMSLGVSGLGTILSGKGVFSMHAKVKIATTTTGANDNNILVANINGTTIGAVLNIDGTAGAPKVRISARSVSTDARQVKSGATTLTAGVDTYVGGIVNIAGDAITVYLNGVSDGTLAATFANATWTLGTPTGADTVGGYLAPPSVTTDQFDGEISEIAVWNIALSGPNFATLASGAPASSVAAGNLVYYLPIAGTTSPEPPTVGAPSGTITGSLPSPPAAALPTRFTFQVGVGDGNYSPTVVSHSPISYWRLGEGSGTVADDVQNANDGSYIGPPTLGVPAIWTADGNTAVSFDGDDSVTMGDVAAFRFTGAFSVTCWIKFIVSAAQSGLVTKCEAVSVGSAGWGLQVNASKQIQFFASSTGAVLFSVVTTLGYGDGNWHHIAATWDGTTAANKVIIYVDGVSVKTGTAIAGTIATGAYPFRLAARGSVAADFYTGTLDEVAVFGSALSAGNVASQASYSGDWASTYNPDWSGAEPTRLRRGMADNVPTSRVASPGTAEFDLINSTRSIGGVVGYYSPDSANFNGVTKFGKRVRWLVTYAGVDYVLWSGRIRALMPDAGVRGPRLCHATAHDAIGDLALFAIQEITPQIGQTESALIQTVLNALPANVRPQSVIDGAVETYPYALDKIGGDAGNGLTALDDLVLSAWGLCWADVYNAIKYRNRVTQDTKPIAATLTDSDIEEFEIFGSRDRTYNRVRVTVHPRRVDAAATTVLCSGAGQLIPANGTVTLWLDYRDPATTTKLIGGTAQVTPLTTPAHYLANAAADGSGANLTANISITTTAFAAAAKFVIVNSGGTAAYMTLLQLLGKGIYDDGPVTHQIVTAVDFYDTPLMIDMPYKSTALLSGGAGATIANFLAGQLLVNTSTISEVAFNPHRSPTLMGYALTIDIGDRVQLSETVTGVTSANGMVVGITHELAPGPILRTRWLMQSRIDNGYVSV